MYTMLSQIPYLVAILNRTYIGSATAPLRNWFKNWGGGGGGGGEGLGPSFKKLFFPFFLLHVTAQ